MKHDSPALLQRICIIGTSGAGKTTLARQVSQKLIIPHFELDSFYWEPNWVIAPVDVFRRRVEESLMGNSLWLGKHCLPSSASFWKRSPNS